MEACDHLTSFDELRLQNRHDLCPAAMARELSSTCKGRRSRTPAPQPVLSDLCPALANKIFFN
ncbi:hypothetical protein EV13_0371 [Prochlorococcus sp. MIT 0702]|nr:hypothetical protein EV12_0103 [Prochlorococcus sp. MIT 0701]KGG30351.1 hypothetical protein EV13_0371 [Prochlorococcus sp. MIT 0702]KGG35769.1 hypothetical protein EV14_0777 [Prochlorococcus sp. MIT 0703]